MIGVTFHFDKKHKWHFEWCLSYFFTKKNEFGILNTLTINFTVFCLKCKHMKCGWVLGNDLLIAQSFQKY